MHGASSIIVKTFLQNPRRRLQHDTGYLMARYSIMIAHTAALLNVAVVISVLAFPCCDFCIYVFMSDVHFNSSL